MATIRRAGTPARNARFVRMTSLGAPLAAALALAACASGSGAPPAAAGGGGGGRQVYAPANAPRQTPVYSPAVRVGNLVFFSGQIGSRPGGGGLPEGVQDQVRQALENLRNLLNTTGLAPKDLVKCTVFLADIRDYGAMNEIYGPFFAPDPPPARTALAVAGLPGGARVEIECIGAVPGT
jgi:2-iminobutanoate/2-iminopropanoate deaminase